MLIIDVNLHNLERLINKHLNEITTYSFAIVYESFRKICFVLQLIMQIVIIIVI